MEFRVVGRYVQVRDSWSYQENHNFNSPKDDKLIWIKDPKKQFSTKSAYRLSQEHRVVNSTNIQWLKLWKMKLQERVKILIWRIGNDILPTKGNLATRLGQNDTSYPLCYEEIENNPRLFFYCTVAKAVWFGCNWGLELRCLTLWTVPIMQRILLIPLVMIATNFILKSGTRAKILTIALIIDAIWNLRNQVVLNGD